MAASGDQGEEGGRARSTVRGSIVAGLAGMETMMPQNSFKCK
ncbi:hypothetical protein [Paraburkholderia eburnea]|nr:hypothetical protein [Paraburkholderia eburnea]